jgi:hypothetical protein
VVLCSGVTPDVSWMLQEGVLVVLCIRFLMKGYTMKFQVLALSGLMLGFSLCLTAGNKAKVIHNDSDECACECLPMPCPVLEKCSSQCSVEEKMPAHCFKVEKVQKTTDLYKIAPHSRRCCTITDENGTRPCGCGDELKCRPCEPKRCAPRCEKKCCPVRSERKCRRNRCGETRHVKAESNEVKAESSEVK